MKQANPPPAPITFRQNVMTPPTHEGEMSQLIFAGTPSPWNNVADVPERLREFIGMPVEPPHKVDSEAFRAETRMIQEALEPENEAVRAVLQNIDDEAHQRAKTLAAAVIVNETPKGTYDD